MRKLHGVFDNHEMMQREVWIDGELAGKWPAEWCASGLHTVFPWERKALEGPWGFYPDPPPRDT